MQDRFKFRAIVKGYYEIDTPEEHKEFEPLIFLEDVDVLSNGQIGIMEDRLEVAIREQHPNVDSVNIGYMLEYFRDNGCGVDNYTTMTPEVIYQCTGLKDKHGKLIFEGDIIKYFCPAEYCSDGVHKCLECYSGENGSVHYDEDLAMYEYRSKSSECPLTDNINTEEDLEIIGNIYENPELLSEVE